MCPLSDSGGSGAPSLFLAIGPEDWCRRRDGAGAAGLPAAPAKSVVAGVTASARPIRRALLWTRSLRDLGGLRPPVRLTEFLAEKGPR